ncbi:MAG: T9SS type A sorting domain-containing protein [Cyclobacteriaceae bacterium]
MKKTVLAGLAMAICVSLFSQNQNGAARLAKLLNKAKAESGLEAPEDDLESRNAFEKLRLQNPETGEIPDNIRKREIDYFNKGLRKAHLQARVAEENLIVWKNRGPYNVGGRTRALAIDVTNEDVILAGGVSGGVWRTDNGGASWSKTTSTTDLQSVTAIAQDTRDGHTNVWYYTTGEWSGNSAGSGGAPYRGDGVFKSTDGGLTWAQLPSTTTDEPEVTNVFDYNHEIVVSPTDGTIFIANFNGIYRSTDGGALWDQSYSISGSGWTDVVIDSNGVVYAFHRSNGVVTSTDNGDSWQEISDSNFPTFFSSARGELAIAPSDENVIYLLAETSVNSSGHALWRYDGSTGQWSDRSDNIPQEGGHTGDFDSQGGYDLLLKVKPDDEGFVIIGGTNLYRSTDGFASTANTSWIGGYTPSNDSYATYSSHHPDNHCMVFYPSNPNKAISGNDGGLQVTKDITSNLGDVEPVDWDPINNGYLTTQSYAVSVGPGAMVLSGFQDNGTWFSDSEDPKHTWVDPFSGDGAYNAISTDGLMGYVSSQNANVYRLEYSPENPGTATDYIFFFDGEGKSPLFISPFYLDPLDNDIFYMGGMTTFHVNTSAETGTENTGWKEISLPNVSGRISEIGPIGNGDVYVGTTAGELFLVTDVKSNSPSVTEETSSLFSGRYISGISVNPDDADEILLTVSNYGVQSVFHSTNGGSSWDAVGGNLEENTDGTGSGPSVRCGRIVGNGELYIVATSVGLFTTTTLDGNNTVWEQENLDELGAVVVEHLAVRNTDGLVVAGTHGNGVYAAKFPLFETDLGVSSIESPNNGVLSAAEQISVAVTNYGANEVTAFSVKYSVNGTVEQSDDLEVTLASGETYVHQFSQTYDFSVSGSYDFSAEVEIIGDQVVENDELTKNVESYVLVGDFPYAESFESGAGGWTTEGLWELGTPAQTILAGASDGTQAWMTDLDADYPDNTTKKLLTPTFDFSSMNSPQLSFDINYDIEVGWDGVVLAYRTDLDNATFTVIGNEYGTENWYPALADVFGFNAWTGTVESYTKTRADVGFLGGEQTVQFAFIFASDQLEHQEGFAMDDFRITDDLTVNNEIMISVSEISENNSINDVVGVLSIPNVAESVVYTMVAGEGDTDNGNFTIVGDEVLAAVELNHETQDLHTIRVQGVSGATTATSVFVISVLDVNEPLNGVLLSSQEIEENSDVGTTVGLLSADDEDTGEAFSFAFVAGAGDDNNGDFGIFGSQLRTSEAVNFEEKASYSVRIEATSGETNEKAEETFAIAVLDANDAPGDFVLSSNLIPDLEPSGFVVGDFSATDEDEDAVIFDFTDGDGDDDNISFSISGTQLMTSVNADFATQELYRVLVEASDGKGGFTVEPFEVSVEEILGMVNLAKLGVSISPNPTEDVLNVKMGNKFGGSSSITITTLDGKEVLKKQFNKTNYVEKDKLDLSALAKGVYIITFDFNGRTTTGRVVKK